MGAGFYQPSMTDKKKLFIEHDGAIDDLLAQLLVLCMPGFRLAGINVTPADCYIIPALDATHKILQLFGQTHVPVGRSYARAVHEFPAAWRAKTSIINALPALLRLADSPDPDSYPEACSLLEKVLSESDEPVHLLITGPCSNLVKVLEKNPQLRSSLASVVWMGGAFRTGGNVQHYEHDGSAEWNVFWDPESSARLLEMELPLTAIPLDVTDKVPVKMDFLRQLAREGSGKASELAGQFWSLTVDTIPGYHYTYYMWDILAAAFLEIPECFAVEEIKAEVSVKAPEAGRTKETTGGHRLRVAFDVDENAFYRYLLERLN